MELCLSQGFTGLSYNEMESIDGGEIGWETSLYYDIGYAVGKAASFVSGYVSYVSKNGLF
jgi:hypothetical protein